MTLRPLARARRARLDLEALHRLAAVTVLGFASGLPLALTGQAMQAWLSADGVDIATIGFLSLVGLPYTFKFLWAPLMDRFELPLARPAPRLAGGDAARARRRAVLDGGDAAAARRSARSRCWRWPGGLPVGVAGRRRSTPTAPTCCRAAERGLGSSLNVLGYRLAMIVSGGVALHLGRPARKAAAGPGPRSTARWPG